MDDQKSKILQMVRDEKISVKEGVELLDALDDVENGAPNATKKLSDRFLRVRVNGADTNVNVNIPLALLKVASQFMSLIPEDAHQKIVEKGIDISKIDFEELIDHIDQGLTDGKLVDVDAEDPQEGRIRVEVYVE